MSDLDSVLKLCNSKNIYSISELLNQCSSITLQQIKMDLEPIDEEKFLENFQTSSGKLYIFSDGNCKFNGNKNGKSKGAYSIYFADPQLDKKFSKTDRLESHIEQTNNKAELTGIVEIFRTLINYPQEFQNFEEIIICTDSKYSIDCIQKWSRNWIKNGWKTSTGAQVKNRELIEEILDHKNNFNYSKIIFQHVLSHQSEPRDITSLDYLLWYGNNKVDTSINQFLDKLSSS